MGSRDRLREYFLKNVGKVLTTHKLAKVAGVSEYARRIRELRDEEGWLIKTHNDDASLKPGEYILISNKPVPSVSRDIGPDVRARILERNGYTCQMCGAGAGESDPYDPQRKVRLNIDHKLPVSKGGTNEDSNLRVICNLCNQGRSNTFMPPSSQSVNVISIVRRQQQETQKEVLRFLLRKFKDDLEKILDEIAT